MATKKSATSKNTPPAKKPAKAKPVAKKTTQKVKARLVDKPDTKNPIVQAKPAKKSSDSKRSSRPRTPKAKRPVGRPAGTPDVWTPEYIAKVADELMTYVEKTAYPSVAEFCYLHGISRQRLYENVTLDAAREWLLAKKEAYLEQQGTKLTKAHGSRGTFIIFALKQLGWKDNTEIKHTGNLTIGEPPLPPPEEPEEAPCAQE